MNRFAIFRKAEHLICHDINRLSRYLQVYLSCYKTSDREDIIALKSRRILTLKSFQGYVYQETFCIPRSQLESDPSKFNFKEAKNWVARKFPRCDLRTDRTQAKKFKEVEKGTFVPDVQVPSKTYALLSNGGYCKPVECPLLYKLVIFHWPDANDSELKIYLYTKGDPAGCHPLPKEFRGEQKVQLGLQVLKNGGSILDTRLELARAIPEDEIGNSTVPSISVMKKAVYEVRKKIKLQ